jgi:FAD:protein FMN transferase
MSKPDPMDLPGRARPTRRDFLALGMGAFIVAAVPVAARRQPALVRRSVPAMGTIAEFAVLHRDARHAHRALDAAVIELGRVEQLMSRFRADSDIGRANRAPPGTLVSVAPETRTVLLAALHWAERSGGAFDPCLARAVALWDVTQRSVPPPADELQRLAGRQLYRGLDLDDAGVVRRDADVALDLGAIAKGYGVDRAVAALRDWGITRGLVNAGGDIYALGDGPDGPWHIGIRAPGDPTALAGTLRVSDAAVATSGDYAQYFEHDGRRYHHLLDPEAAAPRPGGPRTVSVRASCCMHADAAATVAFILPAGRAQAVLNGAPGGAVVTHVG